MIKKLKIFYLLTLKGIKNFRFEKKYLVFLFFLFLSTVFWFLNALDKEYISFIQVPIQFQNVAENKILTSNQTFPEELNVKINSRGFKIFKYNSAFFKLPIKIKSNSKYIEKAKHDSLKLFLPTSKLKNLISAHLGEEFTVLDVQPDSLVFSYENTISKLLAVKPNININLKAQFTQTDDFKISPDSILVTGTKELLDSVKNIKTKLYEFVDVDNNLDIVCELKPIEGLKFKTKTVNIHIPIEEYTEKTMNIPIEKINLPENYELTLFPQVVHIQFNISISNYLKVKKEDFKFTVDYSEIAENVNHLKIKLENKSRFAFDLKFSPKKVEYILEK